MSFKFLFFLFFLSACGVKGPPKEFSETAIDSYIKNYAGEGDKQKNKEDDKKETSKPTP